MPPEQVAVALGCEGHTVPQAPQLFTSDEVFVQTPPHMIWLPEQPVEHAQVPRPVDWQTGVVPLHAFVQLPHVELLDKFASQPFASVVLPSQSA